ncbi:hypothetical protein EPK84_04655 (plasmid) [Sinorhizobium fredii]|nr:transposase [Sinorhizobium fredii]UTY46213.1 hypothetical protein EPK84_04655 [Sinorhizobium fredii]
MGQFSMEISKYPAMPGRFSVEINNWRRIATRYDKLARNFMAAVELAATIIW